MSFIETRFPEGISYGATGGPGYLTDVIVVNSGAEQRNQVWSQARCTFDVAHAARLPAAYKPLQAFFRVMAGRTHGFRFKDWSDYVCPDDAGTGTFQTIDSTHFQMYKRYFIGSNYEYRKITKPVTGTVAVTGGTSPSVAYTTGIVTVSSGTPTSWTGEFDVPCRFDVDQMRGEIVSRSGGSLVIGWQSIPIIELRL